MNKQVVTVTTRLPDSTGVRPVWMGSTGKVIGGFEQQRYRNPKRLSPKDAVEMEKIRCEMLVRQLSARSLMGSHPSCDCSKLSPRLKRRLGLEV